VNDFVSYLFTLLDQYGYGAVFVGVMLDSAGIPLAGELTLLLAGNLVVSGSFGWMPTVLVAAVAALLSDIFWYAVGRLGSTHLVRVYCRLSFGSTACLTRTEEMLARFGPRSLILSRFVPGFRTFAAPMSGISGLTLPRFVLFDGIGALLWSGVFVTLGMFLADQINKVVEHMQVAHNVMLLVASSMLGLFVMTKIWVRVRHGKAEIPTRADLRGDGT